ncbi:hypothetical protein pdam_00008500 [Pocillopora damicornis]|uniref:Uncharacterized protein n=1 Tax=Pocillopora damicornis TaxID=46731 RepID=A0A3M6U4G3_POCDA|nr:hypothetical protein pdam_00008500 [Pocillopora damicornis]
MSFSRSSKKDLPNDVALDEVNKHITYTLSILSSEISTKSDSQNDAKESEMSFSRSSKKDLPNDVALDEVNKHITDTLSILRREISKEKNLILIPVLLYNPPN